ncbi:hypothetical protein VTN96DRAFT_10418 [Rasamsonia emersonii]
MLQTLALSALSALVVRLILLLMLLVGAVLALERSVFGRPACTTGFPGFGFARRSFEPNCLTIDRQMVALVNRGSMI